MKNGRTHLEMLLRKLASMFGYKFRFHRLKKERFPSFWVCRPNNSPRTWSFEWWKSRGNVSQEVLLKVENMPYDECKTKDEAIKHVLLKTDFLKDLLGCSIQTYEQLCIMLDLMDIEHDANKSK